jgi:Holliday junction resolvase
MGKHNRQKGKSAELELASIIRETYGWPVRRGHVFEGEPDIVGLEGIHVEVKRTKSFHAVDFMVQAARYATHHNGGYPAVFYRADRKPWTVTMLARDWYRFSKDSNPEINVITKERFNLYKALTNKYEGIVYRKGDQSFVTMWLPSWMDIYGWWRSK